MKIFKSKNGWTSFKQGLVVKLMLGNRGMVVKLNPLVLTAMVGLSAWGGSAMFHRQETLAARYEARIAELETEKSQIHTFLARKDREKKQALALAQSRSDQLWSELQTRDQQMEQIWKVVGKQPKIHHGSRRHSLMSSRGAFAIKRRYLELATAIEGREGEMKDLKVAAGDYRRQRVRQAQLALWSTQPSIWPCSGVFSSPFGYRTHPILGYARLHSGVDVGAAYGTPIVATAAGRVTGASYLGGYGLAVTIDHGHNLSTLYGHCSRVAVSVGQYVRKGQVVSYVGSTGMSTGPHCHYEVARNGTQIDPAPFMRSLR